MAGDRVQIGDVQLVEAESYDQRTGHVGRLRRIAQGALDWSILFAPTGDAANHLARHDRRQGYAHGERQYDGNGDRIVNCAEIPGRPPGCANLERIDGLPGLVRSSGASPQSLHFGRASTNAPGPQGGFVCEVALVVARPVA
jgi:hypothetical protein